MSLTQAELLSLLSAAELPAWGWQLADESYETCTPEFVERSWSAWMDARPASLCQMRDLGGGKNRRVPRWIAQAGDCDNLALSTLAWADTGNALAAAERNQMRGGLAYGILFYTAGPARAENYNVAGRHAINWFVSPTKQVLFFEPGVGSLIELTPVERASAWFGLAA